VHRLGLAREDAGDAVRRRDAIEDRLPRALRELVEREAERLERGLLAAA
jgi:hypothetical protein